MQKSKIILRLGIYSEDDSSIEYFNEIKNKMPIPTQMYLKNNDRILSNGKKMPFKNKQTLLQFNLISESFSLEDINKSFIDFWIPYNNSLKLVTSKYNFNISLDYEITVYNNHYPSILFPVDFLSFLNDNSIQLSINFYND